MNAVDTTRRLCLLGATSAMAMQTARLLARDGHRMMLVARNGERLDALAGDMTARGAAAVHTLVQDLEEIADPAGLFADIESVLGGLDGVLIFHGRLDDHETLVLKPDSFERSVSVNFSSAARLALASVPWLERSEHPRPVLLAIGSVAGDRGRANNYVYGAGKAALSTLLEGMAHESAVRRRRLKVVVVKAGLTRTPMTETHDREGPLWSSAERVARTIHRAMDGRRTIVYAPWFWRPIMLVMRGLPQAVMHRLDI